MENHGIWQIDSDWCNRELGANLVLVSYIDMDCLKRVGGRCWSTSSGCAHIVGVLDIAIIEVYHGVDGLR